MLQQKLHEIRRRMKCVKSGCQMITVMLGWWNRGVGVKNGHNCGVDGVRLRFTHIAWPERQLVIKLLWDRDLLPVMPKKISLRAK